MHPNYVKATDINGVSHQFNTNQIVGVPESYSTQHGAEVILRIVDGSGAIQGLCFSGSQAKMNALYNHLVNGSLLDLDEGDF